MPARAHNAKCGPQGRRRPTGPLPRHVGKVACSQYNTFSLQVRRLESAVFIAPQINTVTYHPGPINLAMGGPNRIKKAPNLPPVTAERHFWLSVHWKESSAPTEIPPQFLFPYVGKINSKCPQYTGNIKFYVQNNSIARNFPWQ